MQFQSPTNCEMCDGFICYKMWWFYHVLKFDGCIMTHVCEPGTYRHQFQELVIFQVLHSLAFEILHGVADMTLIYDLKQ